MKVRNLEKGMMLTCSSDDECFAIYGSDEKWVMVRAKPKHIEYWGSSSYSSKICPDKVMIYLGTKKDIDINMKWTDRFVLINNQIVGVDPAAWKRIKPVL